MYLDLKLFLGLKKIQDFTVTLPDLRISMYEVLFYLGYSPEDKLSDVEESAVVNICLRTYLLFKNNYRIIDPIGRPVVITTLHI